MVGAIYAIVKRDVKRFVRQKTRILSSVVRPLLWLWIVGSGFGSVLRWGVSTPIKLMYYRVCLD